MKNTENFPVTITPVASYTPPNIPTLADKPAEAMQLLPSRWQKNAKVMACVGIAGTLSLAGLASACIHPAPTERPHHGGAAQPYYFVYPTEAEISETDNFELSLRLHTGGRGGSFYIVHITEQEAFALFRAHLEAAGLNFSATPPAYTVPLWPSAANSDHIALDLFDEAKGVAISHVSWADSNLPFRRSGPYFVTEMQEAFAALNNQLTFGVFYTPGAHWDWDADWWVGGTPPRLDADWIPDAEHVNMGTTLDQNTLTPDAKDEARATISENITAQASAFIALLQDSGVLEAPPNTP